MLGECKLLECYKSVSFYNSYAFLPLISLLVIMVVIPPTPSSKGLEPSTARSLNPQQLGFSQNVNYNTLVLIYISLLFNLNFYFYHKKLSLTLINLSD